jgi:uncharacterized protein YbjT (DUF2867 family)
MKYVITGSLGHISKPLVARLVKAGHDVTVVSSNADRTAEIESLGAKAAVGSIEDVAFLTKTFSGADAVYTMVPPKWDATEWKNYIHGLGKNYASAIKAAGVKKVVNLSSVGAHMPAGCGPVSGLHGVETELNKLEGTDVKHLRPGFFYYNLLANIGMVKHMGIIGGNYGEGTTLVLAHPNDIAAAAADELLDTSFQGKTVRYIASDERTTTDIAKVLGAAIGKSELPWVNFKDEDSLNGMLQAGLSHEVATNYVEMGAAVASGEMFADYLRNKPTPGATKLEDFAKEFSAAYAG